MRLVEEIIPASAPGVKATLSMTLDKNCYVNFSASTEQPAQLPWDAWDEIDSHFRKARLDMLAWLERKP